MSRLNRLESQNATRTRLRRAARHEFASKGVAAASIDRIAEQAGFSRGAFYSNYASKRELLLELVDEHNVQEIATWQGLIDQADDLEQVLPELERQFNQYAADRQYWLLAVELLLEAERDAEFGAVYRRHALKVLLKVRELVRAMALKAGAADDADIDTVAVALQSLSLGLMFAQRRSESGGDEAPGQAMTLFLRKILQKG